MKLRFWGVRGSLPVPTPAVARYGGNTSCVEVVRADDPTHIVVLDAGTGIVPLGHALSPEVRRVDLLLGHLHMDHIIGLGFFAGFYRRGLEVHLWGPSSALLDLRSRLSRYLSPPLFPVRLRELPCSLAIHDTPLGPFDLPGFTVTAALVCHPGPTVGYRLDDGTSAVTYLSDNEPALGARRFPDLPRWTSGYDLAAGADVLVHDAQYDDAGYRAHVGWGHSSLHHALDFASLAGARHLVAFHHDPSDNDDVLDARYADPALTSLPFPVTPAREGFVLEAAAPADVQTPAS